MINTNSLQLKLLFIKIPERKQATHWGENIGDTYNLQKNLDQICEELYLLRKTQIIQQENGHKTNRHFTEMEL